MCNLSHTPNPVGRAFFSCLGERHSLHDQINARASTRRPQAALARRCTRVAHTQCDTRHRGRRPVAAAVAARPGVACVIPWCHTWPRPRPSPRPPAAGPRAASPRLVMERYRELKLIGRGNYGSAHLVEVRGATHDRAGGCDREGEAMGWATQVGPQASSPAPPSHPHPNPVPFAGL